MAMVGNDRGDAAYTAIMDGISADLQTKMSQAEKDKIKAAWRALMGADVNYLSSNVDVSPDIRTGGSGSALTIPTTTPVTTTGTASAQTGFVQTATEITGKGSIA